jgi:predicted TIM-barrel fold metal-dependent hydrolase
MKTLTKLCVPVLALLLVLSACNPEKDKLYQRMPKIDAHVHIRTNDPAVMEYALSEGFQLLTINTRSNSQEHIDSQKEFAMNMKEAYPDDIEWLTTFSMEGFEEPEWAERAVQKLQEDLEQGAVGFKIWKDIGMTFRDSIGRFVFLDDPVFTPILEFMEQSGRPLLTHIGEPRNCWLPVDSMTVKGDQSYFSNNPQYHAYLQTHIPSHERLMESRDYVLATYPNLKMVGAHLGSLEWDVDVLAERLDRYPNFAVDMAARVCHFQVQNRDKVRAFIIKYQDRLLYATDLGVSEDFSTQKKAWLGNEWHSDWAYFATGDVLTSRNLDQEFQGLDLDPKVLRKIYYTNAIRWYPDAFN